MVNKGIFTPNIMKAYKKGENWNYIILKLEENSTSAEILSNNDQLPVIQILSIS